MANTYTSLNYHLVVSTKNREPWFIKSICEWLWPYLVAVKVIDIFGNDTITVMTVR
jgi:hypothetical protein